MINSTYGLGSTGKNCAELIEHLYQDGYEGYVAYSTGDKAADGYIIGNSFEKKIHALLSRIFGLQGYFSTFGTRKLIRYINNLKPDIVHFHNVHSNYLNIRMLFSYLSTVNIPIVLNLHDCWFYTGKCCHYTDINCYKWKSGCCNCPKLRDENVSWIFDKTRKMWRDKNHLYHDINDLYVIGVSDWITDQARESILKSARKIIRIYNWVNFNTFKLLDSKKCKEQLKLPNKLIILGVATTWDKSKGIDRFVELAKKLDDSIQIVLVGDYGNLRLKQKNIILTGSLNNFEELAKYYSAADVFVTMSYEESFGKVSAEALACGTPVICFDSTANPEIVGEGCGYVIPKGNIKAMAEAIHIIQKRGKAQYSNACIAYAKANFDKDKNISKYIKLYKEILGDETDA